MIFGVGIMALVQDFGKCSASRGFYYAIFCLDYSSEVFKVTGSEA